VALQTKSGYRRKETLGRRVRQLDTKCMSTAVFLSARPPLHLHDLEHQLAVRLGRLVLVGVSASRNEKHDIAEGGQRLIVACK
jgi:hypothetical protein